MSYTSEVLADTPALFWKLDEKSGLVAADSSGNGVAGAYSAGVSLGNAALLVDAGASSVSIPSADSVTSAGVDLTATDFAIELWLKPSALALAAVVNGDSGAYTFAIGDASGHFRTGIAAAADAPLSTGVLVVNAVNHCIVSHVKATGATQYWLNGADAGLVTYTTAPTPAAKSGKTIQSAVFPYSGLIEALALYKHTLSQARVQAHYVAGTTALGIAPSLAPSIAPSLAPTIGH